MEEVNSNQNFARGETIVTGFTLMILQELCLFQRLISSVYNIVPPKMTYKMNLKILSPVNSNELCVQLWKNINSIQSMEFALERWLCI